jgi:hypothetical protein
MTPELAGQVAWLSKLDSCAVSDAWTRSAFRERSPR